MAWDSTYHPSRFILCGVRLAPYFPTDWSYDDSENRKNIQTAYNLNTDEEKIDLSDDPTSALHQRLRGLPKGSIVAVVEDGTAVPKNSTTYWVLTNKEITVDRNGKRAPASSDSEDYPEDFEGDDFINAMEVAFTWDPYVGFATAVTNPYSFYLPPESRYYNVNDFNFNWYKLSGLLHKISFDQENYSTLLGEFKAELNASKARENSLLSTSGGAMAGALVLPGVAEELVYAEEPPYGSSYAATRDYVDSKIKTEASAKISSLDGRVTSLENWGVFIGSFDTLADLRAYSSENEDEITNNDFATVKVDADGKSYRYIAEKLENGVVVWKQDIAYNSEVTGKQELSTADYSVGMRGGIWRKLEKEQIDALNSEVTKPTIANLVGHTSDNSRHINSGERARWDGKEDVLTFRHDDGIEVTRESNEIIMRNTKPNVQADWDEEDASEPSYIWNKPDLSDILFSTRNLQGTITASMVVGDEPGFSVPASHIDGCFPWDKICDHPLYLHNTNKAIESHSVVVTDENGHLSGKALPAEASLISKSGGGVAFSALSEVLPSLMDAAIGGVLHTTVPAGSNAWNLNTDNRLNNSFAGFVNITSGGPAGYTGSAFLLNIPGEGANCMQLIACTEGLFYRISKGGPWSKVSILPINEG